MSKIPTIGEVKAKMQSMSAEALKALGCKNAPEPREERYDREKSDFFRALADKQDEKLGDLKLQSEAWFRLELLAAGAIRDTGDELHAIRSELDSIGTVIWQHD